MELRSPIRLYWDISPALSPAADYTRICSEITSSRALTIHLTDLGDVMHPSLADIVTHLAASPLVISLTVSHKIAAQVLPLSAAGVNKLYADVLSAEDVNALTGAGISGISFRTTRHNSQMLPGVIAACIRCGIAELQLPMERLISGAESLCLSPAEREDLAARIRSIQFADKLSVTANDPFLWRVVHPGRPFPDGICQAANTMLAIAPNGDVFPCPALPVRLGNLQSATFKEIIASALKKEVRAQILARPAGCSSCQMLDDCRGGCRGRGLHAAGSLDAADPGCGMS